MLPKVHIKYVHVYDEAIASLMGKKHTKLARKGGMLFAKRLKKAVKPMLASILLAMETETTLSWKHRHINCYVAHDIPFDFDDPMTIKVRKNMRDATETFFHELLHQLEMQNEGRINLKNDIYKKYCGESEDARAHIISHAMLWKVYEKVYGKKRLKRIINGYKLWPEHYRAWQIVRKEGPDRILKAYIRPHPPLKAIRHKIQLKMEQRKMAKQKKLGKKRALLKLKK
ncbi:MAG: hypothetical protein QXU82_02845 [Candidatus Aenigmatarchaeota archaeon]